MNLARSQSPPPPNEPGEPFVLQRCIEALHAESREEAISLFECSRDFTYKESGLRLIHLHFDKLEALSYHDYLTGLFNRKYFDKQLHQYRHLKRRYQFPFSIALLDIDHFKEINDSKGHVVGDQILRELAGFLHTSLRHTDIVTRYGGDEFGLIFPGTADQNASQLVSRLFKENAPINFSIGFVSIVNTKSTIEEIVAITDDALYKAKKLGGNQYVQNQI